MPRAARKRSASGYYHVVPKGIAGQTLFGDNSDRRKYLGLLREAKEEYGVRLHACCLMNNHVHLVVQDPGNNAREGAEAADPGPAHKNTASMALSEAMKYVGERYGAYYADKICRRDGIFRKPFWSEPIEDDARLLCAVRYVHANPAAAGICQASAYPWSTVGDYLGHPDTLGLADTEVVLDLLGGRKGFIEWSKARNSTALPFEGSRLRNHLSDDEAIRLARDILGHDPRSSTTPEEALLLLERCFGVGQIERITGISRYRLRRT